MEITRCNGDNHAAMETTTAIEMTMEKTVVVAATEMETMTETAMAMEMMGEIETIAVATRW